jgi:hypothetical protein
MRVEDECEDTLGRFGLDLFIFHPTLTPDEITAGCRMQPRVAREVGQPAVTPKGTPLNRVHADTRWRHCRYFATRGQHFVRALAEFAEELSGRREFLHDLRSTGGETSVIVKFLGDTYFGDRIPLPTLSMLVELGLDLGLEVFMVPQNLSGEPEIEVGYYDLRRA